MGKVKGRERILSLHTEHGAQCVAHPGACYGAESYNPEIMIWDETKSQKLNWLCHSGSPIHDSFLGSFIFLVI